MSDPTHQQGITMRYTKAFRCIGPECTDSCCKGWEIPVEKETYKNWQKILPKKELMQKVEKVPGKNSIYPAKLKLTENGRCVFWAKSDLCELHQKFGESSLAFVCRTYPRLLRSIGGTYELVMSMSCPEAARLSLLDEAATELTEFDASDLIKRAYASLPRTGAEQPAYFKSMASVREILLYLFGLRDISVQQRIFAATWFAQKISGFISREMIAFDEGHLLDQLNEFSAPGVLDALCTQYQEIPESSKFSISLIRDILFRRVTQKEGLGPLLAGVMKTYGFEFMESKTSAGSVEFKSLHGTADEALNGIFPAYLSRRNRLQEKYGNRIEIYLENYCRNYLFMNLPIDSASPYAWMQDLVVRLAVIRFLFFSYPGLDSLLLTSDVRDESHVLDEAIVTVIGKFSRGIEHDYGFLGKIYDELKRQQLDSFAHYVLLMKF